MKTRILEFLKAENKSSGQFAEEIGVQPSSISHIISGRNNPSLDFVIKMLNRYPSLSTDWLIFGRGLMYTDNQLNDLFNIKSDEPGQPGKERISEDNSGIKPSVSSEEHRIIHDIKSESGVTRSGRIVFFYDDGTFEQYLPHKS